LKIAFISPPPLKPSEPGLSGAAATQLVRRLGADALYVDASAGWHRHVLAPERLREAAGRAGGLGRGDLERVVAAFSRRPTALRRGETYRDRRIYSSAIADLETALRITGSPYPGLRLGIAMIAQQEPPRRLESSETLALLGSVPGPFDDYFTSELLDSLARARVSHVAVSLTFQQQAPAAFRLATLLAERLPAVRRILGGPLVDCWRAVGASLDRAPFTLFHQILPSDDASLAKLVAPAVDAVGERAEGARTGDAGEVTPPGPRSVELGDVAWDDYLAPQPVLPAALGRGCYWRRCTFCPDHLHPRHEPCSPAGLGHWLGAVAARFPAGAMLHLTDSALPPRHLGEVATLIRAGGLPLRWHGFVRTEPELADDAFVRLLADGGCSLLQLGVESASERLLERMGKGASAELASRVLRAAARARIRCQVYLLFGVPGETDDDREQTLGWVEAHADAIAALNPALLNLPRGSPMHRHPERFGISELSPFGEKTDLSLYDDFRCGSSHPRSEARRWLARRFFKSPAVRAIGGALHVPFKANHLCFLE
jgi:hypothetical protein